MRKLYVAEWKKLWKHRANQVCLLLLLLCVVYQGYGTYQKFSDHHITFEGSIGEDGVTYQGLDEIRYIDSIHHQYAGIIDEAWLKKRNTIVEEKAKEHNIVKVVDEQAMQETFGENWKAYYEKCQKQTLTYKEYSEIYPSITTSADYDPKAILPLEMFVEYFTEESVSGYAMLYRLYDFTIPFYAIERERYLLTSEKVDASVRHFTSSGYLNAHDMDTVVRITKPYDAAVIQAINDQLLRLPMVYDASYGYIYFKEAMDEFVYMYLIILIILAILISSIFSQEYSCQTDQMLRSVVYGNKQQAIAKQLVGMTICFITFCLLVLCIWGIPYLLIGYYSLEQGIHEWPITMAEEMLIFILSLGVSCFAHGALFLWVSSRAKGRFNSLIISVFIVAITCFGGFILQFLGFEDAPSYLIGTNVAIHVLYEPFVLFGFAIMKCYLIAGGWLFIASIFLYLGYRHYKKRDIQNA